MSLDNTVAYEELMTKARAQMKPDTPSTNARTRVQGPDIFAGLSRDELLALLSILHRILEAEKTRELEQLVTELPSLFPCRPQSRASRPDTHERPSTGAASPDNDRVYGVLHYVFSCLTKIQAKMDAPKAGPLPVRYHTCHLSPRKLTVLQWMKEGKTNWEIARILGLRERTVRYHVGGIFEKLNVTSRTQAVARALGAGLIAS